MTLADRYPLLHTPARWEWGGLDVQFSTDLPPDDLVTNIHVVCFIGDDIVLCRDDRDHWILPGGTREAGESIESCVIRELAEEAGAELSGPIHPFGAHYATTDRPTPYRPWQPHPHKAWLWCTADVILTGQPTNPADAEQILEVRSFPLVEAVRYAGSDGSYHPELITLAAELHRR
ncbi:NUDIX domain-containing protein [Nocardia sp. ET3-3]|uniref:NUDIX domain-containing protein n=1 Tax=Nocardia terrae TaxID=2675851 RepID=A0A7K1V7T7_9NOCA|nr:NUDIX domain-containing protein [Nocardia terrae]MVU82715.1 NUDIX domain-containing protein [Nocardia terrae]